MVKVPDFDALYEADPDPFHVRSSFYEQRKLGLVLNCLTKPFYVAAWDPACGIGEMAARLAPRAERVLASDASPQAVHLTRRRCSACSNVQVQQLTQPHPPSEADTFDLIVLSECGFYLNEQGRQDTLDVLHAAAAERAELLAVHYRHQPLDGYGYISGEQVQEEVVDHLEPRGWHHVVQHDDRDFIIDVLELAGP
jgi:SAM-dependent methyltransferase